MLTKDKCCEVQGYLESANKEVQQAEEQPGVREGLSEHQQSFSRQRREENLLSAEPETRDSRRQLYCADEHRGHLQV